MLRIMLLISRDIGSASPRWIKNLLFSLLQASNQAIWISCRIQPVFGRNLFDALFLNTQI
jgi:hypothetical protein